MRHRVGPIRLGPAERMLGQIEVPTGLQIPVQVIPSNSSVIPATTPGTIINVISPEISVSPIGTQFPSAIPLNSLTPSVFNVIPELLDIPDIDNNGSLNTSACFT